MKTKRKTLFFGSLALLITVIVALYFFSKNINAKGFQYFISQNKLYSFDENNVRVTIYLEYDAEKQPVLLALFEPLLENYHLYSKNTPKTGVDGIGRPTLIELSANSSINARGEIIESKTAIVDSYSDLSLSAPLYVYPDGPVALSLPVSIAEINRTVLSEIVFITYMTCSSNGRCTAPVVNKAINITISIKTSQ